MTPEDVISLVVGCCCCCCCCICDGLCDKLFVRICAESPPLLPLVAVPPPTVTLVLLVPTPTTLAVSNGVNIIIFWGEGCDTGVSFVVATLMNLLIFV